MRVELEQVALIEKYLLNQMTADEKLNFEAKMSTNETFKKEVAAQQRIVGAIKRIGIKTSAASAYTAWRLRKWLLRISVAILLFGGTYTGLFFITSEKEEACVPCEEYYQNRGQEDQPALPDSCCQITERKASQLSERTESYGHDFGFEITFDTSTLTDEIQVENEVTNNLLNDPELIRQDGENKDNSNNGNGNNEFSSFSSSDDRIGQSDTVYEEAESIENKNNSSKKPNFLTKTFNPRDSFLDSLQKRDDYKNGNISQEPAFPGGQEALQKYLSRNMNYPLTAIEKGIQGTVYVTFVIDKDGNIQETEVVKGVHKSLDKEAEKVVRNMPKWIPGRVDGKKADLRYTIPVKFVLSDTEVHEEILDSLQRGNMIEYRSKPLNSDFRGEDQLETIVPDTGYVNVKPVKRRWFRRR